MTQLSTLTNDPVADRLPTRFSFPSTTPNKEPGKLAEFGQFAFNLLRGTVDINAAADVGNAAYEAAAGGMTGGLIQGISRGPDAQYPVDPEFRLTEEKLKPYTQGISQDLWRQYSDAHSDAHLEAIYARNVLEMDRRKRLSETGWAAAPAQVLAEVADPINLGLGALTGGTGEVAAGATRLARLAQLTKAGLYAGVPFAAGKALQSTYDPNVTNTDIFAAGASGLGFGLGSELTATRGAITHGFASGFGAAIPGLGIDLSRSDRDSQDAWVGFTGAFLMGGIASGLSKFARDRVMPVMDEQYKNARLADVADAALLTKAGREEFAPQLKPNADIEKLDAHAEVLFAGLPKVPEPAPTITNPEVNAYSAQPKTTASEFTKADLSNRILTLHQEANVSLNDHADIIGSMSKEDAIYQIGQDAYDRAILGEADATKIDPRSKEYAKAVEDAKDALRTSPDPQAQFLVALHDNLPAGRVPKKEVHAPEDIPTGSKFTINGERFRVEVSNDGTHRILTDGGKIPEIPLEVLSEIPIDKGTLKQGKLRVHPGEDPTDHSIPRDANGDPVPLDILLEDAATQMKQDQFGAMGASSAAELKFRGNSIPGEGKNAGTDFEASFIDDSRPSMMKKVGPVSTRWGMNATLSNSESQLARRFSNIMAFDNLPKANGRIYGAGDMWAESSAKSHQANLFREIESDYGAYVKVGGEMKRAEYSEEIAKAVRRGIDGYTGDAQIKVSAKRVQAAYSDLLAMLERHGVKGASDVNARENYFTRRWLPDRVGLAIEQHGGKKVLQLLTEAIQARNEWATDKQAVEMAQAIIKNGGRPGKHNNPAGFLEGSLDEIAQDLAEAHMDPAHAESIITMLRNKAKPEGDQGNPRNLKYRIDMDETHSIQTDKGPLSVEDLLDNNTHRVMRSYIRAAYGNAAGAEALRVLSPDPKNPHTFEGIKARVREEAAAKNLDRVRIEGDILKMEAIWKNTLGLPVSDDVANSRLWKSVNILKSGLSSSMLGNWYAGLTNAAEPIAALAHPDTLGKLIPALPELWATAKDGKPSSVTMRNFEFLTGRGLDQITSAVDTYIPVHGEAIDIALARGQQFAQKARQISGKLSGFADSNDWGYRTLGFGIVQKWGDWGASGKLPPKTVMHEFGLSEGMTKLVLAQIKEHAESTKGPTTGVQMWDLHPEKWTDIEAMSAFRGAVYAETTTRFLNPLPNQLHRWMGTELGSIFAQFRTFNVASWDSKLLQSLHSKNLDHLRMFVTNAGLTSALYALKVYNDSLGRDDAQEYRDKMLDTSHIAKVAFSRSSYMSLLPTAIDATVTPIMGQPVFAFARGSGIQGGSVMSVPLADWFGSGTGAIGGAIRHVYDPDYSFSMQDLRNIRRSIPFIPQVEPLVKGIDLLGRAAGLPEKSKD